MKLKVFGVMMLCICAVYSLNYDEWTGVKTPSDADLSAPAVRRALRETLGRNEYQAQLPNHPFVVDSSHIRQLQSFTLGEGSAPLAPSAQGDHLLLTSMIFVIFGGMLIFAMVIGYAKELVGDDVVIDDPELETSSEASSETLSEERHVDSSSLQEHPPPTSDPEALAARGLYGEAVHQLLLQTVSVLRGVVVISRDLTTREIYALTTLEEPHRSSLHELLVHAERAHFGAHALSAHTFERCLTAQRHLLQHVETLAE